MIQQIKQKYRLNSFKIIKHYSCDGNETFIRTGNLICKDCGKNIQNIRIVLILNLKII